MFLIILDGSHIHILVENWALLHRKQLVIPGDFKQVTEEKLKELKQEKVKCRTFVKVK